MGTEDERRAVPTEDREVLEDLGEGTSPRGLLPTTYKHHPMSLVGDAEVLISNGIVLRGKATVGRGDENHPWEILVTLIRFI